MDKNKKSQEKIVPESIDFFKGDLQEVNLLNIKENISTISILRVGKLEDRDVEFTIQMLEDYVDNFNTNAWGTPLQINLGHNRGGEASGWVQSLFIVGETLKAKIKWTPLGIEKIKSKQYMFTSVEILKSDNYKHFKTGKKVKNVLIGIALTNIPAVKGMDEVALSARNKVKIYLNNNNNMNEKTQPSEEEVKKEVKEEVKEKEKAEEEKVKELSNKAEYVSLSEHLMLKKEHLMLKDKYDRIELADTIKDKLLLSGKRTVGFHDSNLGEVVNFMVNLSDEQKKEFIKLCSVIKHVDFSVKGSEQGAVNYKVAIGSKEKEIDEKATKYMHENKCTYRVAVNAVL